MPPVRRERANQRRRSPSQPKARRTRPKQSAQHALIQRGSSVDDDLGTALALAFSIELMGFGWESFGDDYSKGILTVTRLLIEHLSRAKATYSALREQERKGQTAEPSATTSERR